PARDQCCPLDVTCAPPKERAQNPPAVQRIARKQIEHRQQEIAEPEKEERSRARADQAIGKSCGRLVAERIDHDRNKEKKSREEKAAERSGDPDAELGFRTIRLAA